MSAEAANSEVRGLRPGTCVRGELRAPGSKSLAQRALIAAGLCGGETRIAGLPPGDDVRHALELMRGVGVDVFQLTPAAVRVVGVPPGPHRGWRSNSTLDAGESGTLARFALAVLGLCGRTGERARVSASGTLRRRGSQSLLAALERAGVVVERREWPIELVPIGPPPTVVLRDAVSSQEASALALALAAWPDELELVIEGELPSRPYFEMTLRVLDSFGVRVRRSRSASSELVLIRGPLRAPSAPLAIEPDASLAAVALAAACLSGGEVVAPGLSASSAQGDVRIVEHLRAFGCRALARENELVASGFPQHGAELDLRGEPDLAPVLAIVAAGAALVADDAEATSTLRGLDTLPGKESSRIEVLADALARAGWPTRASTRELVIAKPALPLARSPLALEPRSDHRMAFAFALLGLLRDGVDVLDAGCVAKSWPSFWRDLAALGARVVEHPSSR